MQDHGQNANGGGDGGELEENSHLKPGCPVSSFLTWRKKISLILMPLGEK